MANRIKLMRTFKAMLAFVFISGNLYSQSDSGFRLPIIEVCTAKDRLLKSFEIEGFHFAVNQGNPIMFNAQDSSFVYSEVERSLSVRIDSNSRLYVWQKDDGLFFSIRDTAFLVSSVKDIGFKPEDVEDDIPVLVERRHFIFGISFLEGKIHKVQFLAGGIYYTLTRVGGTDVWDMNCLRDDGNAEVVVKRWPDKTFKIIGVKYHTWNSGVFYWRFGKQMELQLYRSKPDEDIDLIEEDKATFSLQGKLRSMSEKFILKCRKA